MILGGKIFTSLAWIAIMINYLLPFGGQLETVLFWTGIGLAVAHLVEFFIYLPQCKRVGGSMANHFIQCLLFGYVHKMWLDLAEK